MISKSELKKNTEKYGISFQVVEKDYVLGWILAGIYNDESLKKALIFKGGTCLKKCFFNEYRFSEDLDFTRVYDQEISVTKLKESFHEIFAWIYNESGNQIVEENVLFDEYENNHGISNIQVKIPYGGPLKPQSSRQWPKIKLDIVLNEMVVEKPDHRVLYHEYSDRNSNFPKILTYSLHEIIGEKLRALNERCRPRDLYDVVNLFQNYADKIDQASIREIYLKKCLFKELDFDRLDHYEKFKEECSFMWGQQLSHQVLNLGNFTDYWQQAKEIITVL